MEFFCDIARGGFIAHAVENCRVRTDENDAVFFTGAREIWVLREKSVTRMYGVDTFFYCDGDDTLDVEIRTEWTFVLVELVGFIRFEPMWAKSILVSIDRHCADSQFGGGAHHPDGDFRAIGHEDFLDGAYQGFRHVGLCIVGNARKVNGKMPPRGVGNARVAIAFLSPTFTIATADKLAMLQP